MRAVGLLSGGLDSLLAIKVIQAQGIDVDVLQFRLGFEQLHLNRQIHGQAREVTAEQVTVQLGVSVQHPDVRGEFLELVLKPRHGYGSGMNPCVDCKIFILQKAKAYMETHGAQFVFTGEVVGQRPMSQHRQTLRQTELDSGLEGYLLRPLSAQLLPPTIPEQQGWVDRATLLAISGRSRKAQIELARQYHLHHYPQPAGGCLLTDPTFTRRMQDLLTHKTPAQVTVQDIDLLKLGRHFRLADTLKVIVGRHHAENELLRTYAGRHWTAEVQDYKGPFVVIDGQPTERQYEQIAQLLVSYTKAKTATQATINFQFGPECRPFRIEPLAFQIEPLWRLE
jgi:tRNA-uridine 2-sulfurtransferase